MYQWQLKLFAHMLQLSVDDISLNADVYGDSAQHAGNYDQLKVCFVA